jgi:hypothetical protein
MASTEPESDTDALRRLEERLDRAAAAAERLLGDAMLAAGAGGGSSPASPEQPGEPGAGPAGPGGDAGSGASPTGPGGDAGSAAGPTGPGGDAGRGSANGPPPVPPAGWQVPGSNGGTESHGRGELDLLLAILASLRDRIPPELQQRLSEAVREVLLAVRALIDWYLERSERHRAEPTQVQDIPIL